MANETKKKTTVTKKKPAAKKGADRKRQSRRRTVREPVTLRRQMNWRDSSQTN